MTSIQETTAALADACRQAGVDPAQVFQHLDRGDVEAYEQYIGDPNLVRFMEVTADTIQRGRCTCSRCRS
ncbi:MAG: hypothetical protein M0Q42_04895 [Xanthomonadales bacterium]|nr:hypothetical protein [Xanthomonadales bacterium]